MSNGLWLTIAVCGVVTYATRLAGLRLGSRTLPPEATPFLRSIPIAVFAALIAPDLASGGDDQTPRLIAAIVAAAVTYWSGRLWLCLIAGMATYWLTGWLL